MVIDSSWGLGESVVSGKMVPDKILVCKKNGEVIAEGWRLKWLLVPQIVGSNPTGSTISARSVELKHPLLWLGSHLFG